MIELRNLSKSFMTTDGQVDALQHINLTIRDGDVYGIIGMSGAGKSTLVRCINMLERPTEGSVLLDGQDLGSLGKKEIREVRRSVTMIFQSFNLLMQKTCLQNVLFPLKLAKVPRAEAEAKAKELLKTVGLPDKANSYPAQLSGGQQQRVAIARALATNPKVLLCDEATSALDPKTTHSILELIREINREMGITIIVVTHQMEVVKQICERVAFIKDGTVIAEGKPEELFVKPKKEVKAFLQEESGHLPEDGINIQLFFTDESSDDPVITMMARDLGIDFSICWGKLEDFRSSVYGSLVININEKDKEEVLAYLDGKQVLWEVL